MLPSDIKPEEIGIYLRTSTRTQQIEGTIKSQFHFSEYWLKRFGIDINKCRIYRDDGVSSSLLISGRGAGKQLLADCKAGLITVVCFYATDRLSREARDFHEFETLLRKAGVRMISMSENLDSSNEDDLMMMGVFALFGQRERRRYTERSLTGRVRAAHEAKWTGGRAPYGYQIINKKLAIKEPEARVIRLLFDLYIKSKTSTYVENEFFRRKILSPFGKPRWNTKTICDILRSELYKGIKEYNFTDRENVRVECPAIISEEKWNRVQRLLDLSTKHRGSYKADKPYMLSGLVFCGECGTNYYASTEKQQLKKGPKLYRRYHHGYLKDKCPLPVRPMIRAERVDDMVWLEILKWVRNPGEVIKQLQEELGEESIGPIQKSLDRLSKSLKKAKQKKDRIVALLISGILQDNEGGPQLELARNEIKLLEDEIQEKMQILNSTKKGQQYISNTSKLLETLHQSALDADDATKREIVLTLIDRVDIFYARGEKRGGIVTVDIHSCF